MFAQPPRIQVLGVAHDRDGEALLGKANDLRQHPTVRAAPFDCTQAATCVEPETIRVGDRVARCEHGPREHACDDPRPADDRQVEVSVEASEVGDRRVEIRAAGDGVCREDHPGAAVSDLVAERTIRSHSGSPVEDKALFHPHRPQHFAFEILTERRTGGAFDQ